MRELKALKEMTVEQIEIVAKCIELVFNSEIVINDGQFFIVPIK